MAEKPQKKSLLKDHLYGDLLAPEEGYRTDFALGMTYSLGFDALLTAYLAFGLLDDVNDDAISKQHMLLGAIADSSDKVVVFCNKGGIAVPANIQKAHSLLEKNIYEVFDRNNVHANFHPKLWLIREVSKEGYDTQIKLIVTSRNLKFTDTLDCIVCITGKVNKSLVDNEKHEPLAKFVMDVAKCSNLVAGNKKTAIDDLVKDLLKVEKFELAEPFNDYDFFPYFFKPERTTPKFPTELQGKNTIIVSPFIEESILKGFNPKSDRTLITRREYVTSDIFDMFKSKDKKLKDQDLRNVFICKDELAEQGMDLHAKMYHIWSSREQQYLFLGSANATYSAFNRNAEFLLRLKYRDGNIRHEEFLAGFYSEDDDSKFVRMTQADLRDDDNATTDKTDQTDSKVERLMKKLMCSDGLKAQITGPDQDKYSIRVEAGRTAASSDEDFIIQLAPLQKSGLTKQWNSEMFFDDLDEDELSEFFIISATAKCTSTDTTDGKRYEKIIKIPTRNMPKDRDNAIYKSIIKRPSDFFALLEMILTDCPLSSLTGIKAEKESKNATEDGNDKISYYGLYESLLRTAASEPEKIKKIKELADKLDEHVVPEDFKKIIKLFAKATTKQRNG